MSDLKSYVVKFTLCEACLFDLPIPSALRAATFALISSRNDFATTPASTLIPFAGSAVIRGCFVAMVRDKE